MFEALRSLMLPPQIGCGCLGCWLYVDAFDPACFCYVEAWAEVKDLEHEILSLRFTRLLSVMESAARRPVLEFLFANEIRGLNLVEEVRNAASKGGIGDIPVPA